MIPPEFARPSRERTSASTEKGNCRFSILWRCNGRAHRSLTRGGMPPALGARLRDHFRACPPRPLPPTGVSLCHWAHVTFPFIAFCCWVYCSTFLSICQGADFEKSLERGCFPSAPRIAPGFPAAVPSPGALSERYRSFANTIPACRRACSIIRLTVRLICSISESFSRSFSSIIRRNSRNS